MLAARVRAPFESELWNNWYTAFTEESILPNASGYLVLVVVHGGGILSQPERLDLAYGDDGDGEGRTSDGEGRGAACITTSEAADLLTGKLPDGSVIPVYTYKQLCDGVPERLPRRYAVVLEFAMAKRSPSGYSEFDVLETDPLFIARAGGPKAASDYLAKARSRHADLRLTGSWHAYERVEPHKPQTRIVFLSGNLGGVGSDGSQGHPYEGYDADYGIGGDANITNRGRYVAVTMRSQSKSLQMLLFFKAERTTSVPSSIMMRAEAVYGPTLPAALRAAWWRCISSLGNQANLLSNGQAVLQAFQNSCVLAVLHRPTIRSAIAA